jgi:hypothetical protein
MEMAYGDGVRRILVTVQRADGTRPLELYNDACAERDALRAIIDAQDKLLASASAELKHQEKFMRDIQQKLKEMLHYSQLKLNQDKKK